MMASSRAVTDKNFEEELDPGTPLTPDEVKELIQLHNTMLAEREGFKKLEYDEAAEKKRKSDHEHQARVDIHAARMDYADRVFMLIKSWIWCVLLIIIFSGLHIRFEEDWSFKSCIFNVSEDCSGYVDV